LTVPESPTRPRQPIDGRAIMAERWRGSNGVIVVGV